MPECVVLPGQVTKEMTALQWSRDSHQADRPTMDVQPTETLPQRSSFVLGQGMDSSDHEVDDEEKEKGIPPLPTEEALQDSGDSMEFSLQSKLACSLLLFLSLLFSFLIDSAF